MPHSSASLNLIGYFAIAFGAMLAAFAIEVFFIPNQLIDGGVVGLAMIGGYLFGKGLFPPFLLLLNIPFLLLAYRFLGKVLLLHMLFANLVFASTSLLLHNFAPHWQFSGETLEVVAIGGGILGAGLGLIIRYGGCLDGTEILGLIVNSRTGITVGQVVLVANLFVFTAAGAAFQAWHPPILSLITYIVALKIMDAVIVGLDETKAVLIITSKPKEIGEAILQHGMGLTYLYGRRGFSGEEQEILYVIAERLQLADLKELTYLEDPSAFIAIENLHEVANGNQGRNKRGTSWKKLVGLLLKGR